MSAFPVDKLVECFSHAYYRVFMLNGFMAKSGENISSEVILNVSFLFSSVIVKINVPPLSKLSDGKSLFHWQP